MSSVSNYGAELKIKNEGDARKNKKRVVNGRRDNYSFGAAKIL